MSAPACCLLCQSGRAPGGKRGVRTPTPATPTDAAVVPFSAQSSDETTVQFAFQVGRHCVNVFTKALGAA